MPGPERGQAIAWFTKGWLGAYEEFAMEAEQIVDLANGVGFASSRRRTHTTVRGDGSTSEHHILPRPNDPG